MQEMKIVDSFLVGKGVPAFLPHIFVIVVKLLEFDHKLFHSSLMIFTLVSPFVEEHILFEEFGDHVPHVISMMSSILSESSAQFNNISNVKIFGLVF